MSESYSQFQERVASEKVLLATLQGARRLVGFTLDVGSIYELSSFDVAVITSLKVKDNELTSVATYGDLVAGSYFNDRTNKILYVWLEDSSNPTSQFITCTQKYFFSNKGIALPHDLDSGEEVFFEPMIKSTSAFGVELDLVNEDTAAIEGSGSITFHNDFKFWPANFDKVFFENQIAEIYSWSPTLEASEAKLLFRGYIDSKTYNSSEVGFSIKDLLYNLRSTVTLENISELNLRNDPALDSAKQRLIYGRAQGFRPVNLDKLINGSYPIDGTISVFINNTSVIGTGTSFKTQLIPNDKLLINGATYTIASISNDNALELTSQYSGSNQGNIKVEVIPSANKPYINRHWLLAGHPLSQPTRLIQHGGSVNSLVLNSTQDLYDGDDLWIGNYPSGELVKINKVVNNTIVTLASSTEIIYPADTLVTRICVQDVRINDLELVYGEDYEVDPTSAQLFLKQSAEENRSPLLESTERVTVTNGDDFFEGSGTKFATYIKPGCKVRPQSTSEFYTVSHVEDEKIYLTTPYTGTTFTTADSLPEKTSISGLDHYKERYELRVENATDLQGKYFKLYDSAGSVAVWFDIGNIGTEEPDHGCDRSIEITTINSTDNYVTIAQRIKQKLDLDEDQEFVTTILGDVLTITNSKIGVRPVAQNNGESGFTVTSIARDTQRVTVVADVADSLDGKWFVLYDSAGSVAFWIDTDNSGTIEPSHGCDRSVEITTIVTDDDLATVRTKVKAAIEADAAFTTADFLTDSITVTGTMLSASIGTMPINYSLTRIRDGKSIYDLHGKWFSLPYYDVGGDETVGFYFDVDEQGISAPSTGADYDVAVDSITAGMTEEEFFESLGLIIEDEIQFKTEVSANSILVISEDEEAVSTVIDDGTSGLTITQVQAGISANPNAGKLLQYKTFILGDSDILSCTVYGKTVDGDTTSRMLKYAPEIVRDLLVEAGSSDYINEVNFEAQRNFFKEELAFVVPTTYNDKASKLSFRDIINDLNGSVLGILLQSNEFKLEYSKLKPSAFIAATFREYDILSFSTKSTNKNMLLEATVEYSRKEYDYNTRSNSVLSTSKRSEQAQYILGTLKTKTYSSSCINEKDAQRLAERWSFLLENSSNTFTFTTKLQGIQLSVGDIVQIEHEKLYQRVGDTSSNSRLVMIEKIGKRGQSVEIEAIDLSGAFTRCAKITDLVKSYSEASPDERLSAGFYKAINNLIDDDPDTFWTNLIW